MTEAISFEFVFDLLLATSVLVIAWRVIEVEGLLEGIVLFNAFGLLMALCWMRLDAPDVALAEVAVGTGVTGALLLSSLAKLRGVQPANSENEE